MKNEKIIISIVILLTGCADVTHIEQCTTVEPYGLFSGFWHGLIVVFSWIGSLFSDEIAIYAVNNNGGWYDTGFIIGLSSSIASSARATKK